MIGEPALRHILLAVLRPDPDRAAVTTLVYRCHAMALAYLRLKERGGSFASARSGMRVDDMALDAIAELFRRSPQGSFRCLETYFRKTDREGTLTEDELRIELRSIVFSAVNHHIFRMYREQDPALSRIIRNLKLALKHHRELFVTEQWGLAVISPDIAGSEPAPLPLAEPEMLALLFHRQVSPRSSMQEMLGELGEVLRESPGGPWAFPLVDTALMIREIYRQDVPLQDAAPLPDSLLQMDIEAMTDAVLHRLRGTAGEGYLSAGKLTIPELEAHLGALRDILREELSGSNGLSGSYFLHLQRHLGDLTEKSYRQYHRSILEYLARTAKREARKMLINGL
jgi:hypothetical protein